MTPETQDRPGTQGREPGYDPQSTPMSDPSDPRGDLPPGASMGGPRDPYDAPGSGYDEDEKPDGKLRKGLGAAAGAGKGLWAANRARKRIKKARKKRAAGKEEEESSPSDLNDAEEQGDHKYNPEDDDDTDGFFSPEEENGRGARARRFLGRHKKKAMIGGGIMGAVIGGGVGLFMILLPLKIEHIVSNLQGTFFGTSQQALSHEMRNLVKHYLITRAMPGYKACGSTIKPGCNARKFGTGPVADLYHSWANARVERQLAKKGFVLEYRTLSEKWYLKAPGVGSGGVDIGKNGEGLVKEIDKRGELRGHLDTFIKEETRWYQVYTRYKWGRYFERKFGLPRCIVFCGIRDPLADKFSAKKVAAKLYLTQRVITPRNATLGIALECLLNNCAPTDNQPSGDDGENGTPRSKFDADIQEALLAHGGPKLANASADELLEKYKEIEEKGLQNYLVTKALTPIIGKTAAGAAGKAIPIAGWIDLAARMVHFGDHSSEKLVKLRYAINGAAMAATFSTWLIYSDEIHTGHVDPTEVGSFTDSLGPGDQGAPDGKPTGGLAGAEQTKLYQHLIEKKDFGGSASSAVASASSSGGLGGLLMGTAYAAGSSDDDGRKGEICNSGKPVPSGQLICDEDYLGGGNSIANGLHDFLNLPGMNVLTVIADGWMSTFGKLFDLAGGILGTAVSAPIKVANEACDLPVPIFKYGAWCQARDLANKYVPRIVEGVTRWLIQNPFGVPMGGGRHFVMGAGGADVLGNDSCHRELGCKRITPKQKSNILGKYMQDQQMQFSQKPFFARMFDTSSQYSLMSRFAMEVPLGTSAMVHSGVANLLNPVNSFKGLFGSMWSASAFAAPPAREDPFGVPQYGYPEGSIPDNPEKYWKKHCSDNKAYAYRKDNSWNKAASGQDNADPATGEPVNDTVNPCLLIKAATGSGGGKYDKGNLTEEDLASVEGGGSAGGGSSTGTTVIDGEPKELAKALVDSGRLTDEDGRYMAQIQAIANGNYSCNVNPDILKMLYGVVVQDKHSVKMSSLNRFCTGVLTASGVSSYHYADGGGHAVDVTAFDGNDVNGGAEAGTLGYLKAAVKYLPKGSGFGQILSCGSGFNVPEGSSVFTDSCNHQHIQVPKKRIN